MDFNVFIIGINVCVVFVIIMMGLVIGILVFFFWNGVKVIVGNFGEE